MRHIICKLTGGIKDNSKVKNGFMSSAYENGLDIKRISDYTFKDPDGLTMIMLLGESHYSIHTFYEQDMYMVDLFTCSPDTPIKKIINRLAELTESEIVDVVELERT